MNTSQVVQRLGNAPATWARGLLSRGLRRMGYYITRDPLEVAHREHLSRVLSKLRINCVLDVGAHVGGFGSMLRRIGYLGLVISFEPVGENFRALSERAAGDPKWRPYRMALGATRGESEIRVFNGSTLHSFLEPSGFARERFPEKMRLERLEVVPVERLDAMLDHLVAELDDPRIFLKVDTQGFDLEVIRGLGPKIERIDALQLEVTTQPLYEGAANTYLEALLELHQLGFRVGGMYPAVYDAEHVSVLEFDCIMLRRGIDTRPEPDPLAR